MRFYRGVEYQQKLGVVGRGNGRYTVLEITCLGEVSTHGHHQMANTKIRLIISFAAKDGEALYSQEKKGWELTVDQIMSSLLPNSDLN